MFDWLLSMKITRVQYWRFQIWTLVGLASTIFVAINIEPWQVRVSFLGAVIIFWLVGWVIVSIGRLRDRGKSAWWLVIFYLFPLIASPSYFQSVTDLLERTDALEKIILLLSAAASLWGTIELGFMSGSKTIEEKAGARTSLRTTSLGNLGQQPRILPEVGTTSEIDWFYATNESHAGPITDDEIRNLLRRGVINPNTLVWNKTFGESWKPIRDTEIVSELQKTVPRIEHLQRAQFKTNDSVLPTWEKSTTKLSPLLVLLIFIIGIWAYLGFPSPDTLLEWPFAKDECVKFVESHRGDITFLSSGEIRAVDSWWKHGRIIVEVGNFQGSDDTYIPRLCVVGDGTIQIVSILENNAWR